jgi:Tfp pilus assembly protein FimT
MRYNYLYSRGFSFVEAILIIALLSISAGIGIPAFSSLNRQNMLVVAESALVNFTRLAQARAGGIEDDSEWGVSVSTGAVVLFRGATFVARDPLYDETATISSRISVSGLSEIVFSRQDALAIAPGAFILTAPGMPSRTISINKFGMIEY